MRNIYKILSIFCFLLISCSKNSNEKPQKTELNDTITKLKVIKFEKSIGVIFPKSFFNKRETSEYSREKRYFTPNEKTIRDIEKKLPEASKIFDNYWGDSEWQKIFNIKASHTFLYDKQYSGYINQKNDSVIYINLFNFETDPYKLKERIEKEDVSGSDSWYNTNYCLLEYNMNSQSFSSPMDR